jgi:hypothetical protein
MEMIAKILIGLSLVGLLIGTAMLTAAGAPPEWHDWYWNVGKYEIHAGAYGIHWYTPDDLGFYDTAIFIFPLRVRQSYLSKEWSALLRDDRMWDYNSEFRKQHEWVKIRDEKLGWGFP